MRLVKIGKFWVNPEKVTGLSAFNGETQIWSDASADVEMFSIPMKDISTDDIVMELMGTELKHDGDGQ